MFFYYYHHIIMRKCNRNKLEIDNLNIIDFSNNYFYTYKECSFLLNTKSSNNNLIISFHGATGQNLWDQNTPINNVINKDSGKDRYIFRGYKWDYSDCDVLCLSDGLLQQFDDYKFGWYLSTKKHNFDKVYKEIITHVGNLKKYKNIFFNGTSSGGLPALIYSTLFKNSICIISNFQLYLEKYGDREYKTHDGGYYFLKDTVEKNNDNLIDIDINKFIMENNFNKVIIYSNIYDIGPFNTHILPFFNFINSNINIDKNKFEFIFFGDNLCDSPLRNCNHVIFFPRYKTISDIILEYI